jgi:hypothetical protein
MPSVPPTHRRPGDEPFSSIVRRCEQPPWIVSDGLWERVEPVSPQVERRYRYPGRRRLPDRLHAADKLD